MRRPVLLIVLVAPGVALLAAAGLGTSSYAALGLADPGVLVRLAVPVLRVLADLAAAACLGSFVLGLLLDPDRVVPARRAATAAAAVWSAAALATAMATAADVSGGVPRSGGNVLVGLLVRESALGWLVTALLAAGVAVGAREARTWSSCAGAGALAVVALLGPVVTGHAVDGVGHDLALPATAAHVVAATTWLGTLGAALVCRDAGVWRRASRPAAACGAVVVGSGLVQALVLTPAGAGPATPYGGFVLAAGAAAVAALLLRAAVRRGGRRSAGAGVVELVLLAVGTGLSVAMTRAIPPVQGPGTATASEALLGYDLPDPPGVLTLLTGWRVDLTFAALAVVLAVSYAAGLRRCPRWPRGRSLSWFAGCAVLVVATCSGLGRYGPALLSVHVAGHMLLTDVVPVLLVLGAPITLARRTAPDPGRGAAEGARAWPEHLVRSPALRAATHPVVATTAMVASPFLLYLTPAFALTQQVSWLQPVLTAWFLGVGVLFFWMLVGVDPAPHPLPHLARLTILLASMPFHALFGVLLLTDGPVARTPATLTAASGGGQVSVDDFYQRLRLPWAPDLLADQHLAAALSWAMGDLPLLVVLVVLIVQWRRSGAADERSARESLLTLR